MRRHAFIVYVDEDPTGGPLGDRDSARISLQGILNDRIPHYHPIVNVATTTGGIATPTISEGNTEQ